MCCIKVVRLCKRSRARKIRRLRELSCCSELSRLTELIRMSELLWFSELTRWHERIWLCELARLSELLRHCELARLAELVCWRWSWCIYISVQYSCVLNNTIRESDCYIAHTIYTISCITSQCWWRLSKTRTWTKLSCIMWQNCQMFFTIVSRCWVNESRLTWTCISTNDAIDHYNSHHFTTGPSNKHVFVLAKQNAVFECDLVAAFTCNSQNIAIVFIFAEKVYILYRFYKCYSTLICHVAGKLKTGNWTIINGHHWKIIASVIIESCISIWCTILFLFFNDWQFVRLLHRKYWLPPLHLIL